MSEKPLEPSGEWLWSAVLIPLLIGIAAATCNVPGVSPGERQVWNGLSAFCIVASGLVAIGIIVLLAYWSAND